MYGLYIDALETELLAALRSGKMLELALLTPQQQVALLLYADDLVVLTTSGADLQAQVAVLNPFAGNSAWQ